MLLVGPIEYAKVMGQTGKKWILRDVYRGVEFQILRTTALMIPIFSVIDMFRQRTDYLKSYTGNFVITFVVAGGTYCVCAPLVCLIGIVSVFSLCIFDRKL